jgi:signal transduction histidine kinase
MDEPRNAGAALLQPRMLLRVAAWFYLGSGLITLVTLPLPAPRGTDRLVLVAVAVAAMAVGAATLVVPWDRWPWRATLVLVALAFVLIAVGNAAGGGPAYTYGVFFVLVFVWVGIAQPRWTSLAISPVAALAYVVPIILAGGAVSQNVSTVAVTIPIGVLVGESMSLVTTSLRRTEAILREREQRYVAAYERERAAAEALRELDEMKNQFLQAISHEVRTPLAVILGGASTLERSDLDLSEDERREIARSLGHRARKLDAMLQDLLDVDRLARGVLRPRRRLVDVAHIAFRVVEESGLLGDREVHLDLQPAVADIDAAQVERILENLMANATKHTPPTARVWLSTRAGDGCIEILVEDDGPGVSPDVRGLLFRPFTHGSTTPSHAPGVGVGLALVGRFAELHGGRAWVDDRPGGGASFHVSLPSAVSHPGPVGRPTVSPSPVPDLAGRRFER